MKTINFQVEEEIYDPFKVQVECCGMRVAALFKLFMKSYATGNLLIINGEVVSKARSVGAPRKEKEDPPPEVSKPEKATPPSSKKLGWFEQDHSEKKLEEFDVMVISTGDIGVHINAETKPMLELLSVGENTKEDFEDMLDTSFYPYRDKFNDDEWEKEQWHYCLLCAKKFLTKNNNVHRYEEDYLRGELYVKLGKLEEHHQWMKEEQEVYDRTHPKDSK